MKRFTAALLLLAGMTLSAWAQRSGSHSGFSGHTASGFHPGFSASAPSSSSFRSAAGPRYVGNRPNIAPRSLFRGSASQGPRFNYSPAGRYRRSPYRLPYMPGNLYGVLPFPVWSGVNYLGYPDALGYDDSAASQAPLSGAGDGYEAPQAEQDPRPAYQPSSSMPQPAPATEEAVTLVFKDHRPVEQIHNYLLSGSTLTVWDGRHRDIPVDQLDVAATEKVNREAGIDFRLPGASR